MVPRGPDGDRSMSWYSWKWGGSPGCSGWILPDPPFSRGNLQLLSWVGLSASGWWGGSCQGTAVLLSSVVKAPQPANRLDTEVMIVSLPTPRGVGQAAEGWCGFTRRLGFLPLAKGRAKCPDA